MKRLVVILILIVRCVPRVVAPAPTGLPDTLITDTPMPTATVSPTSNRTSTPTLTYPFAAWGVDGYIRFFAQRGGDWYLVEVEGNL